jgi:hypothetical protein
MGSDSISPPQLHFPDRHKRHADDAFGQEKSSDYLQREAFREPEVEEVAHEGEDGVQELGTRIMAHMLGLHIPGIEASTSYYPGYEWWPRSSEAMTPSSHPVTPMPPETRPALSLGPGVQEWPQTLPPPDSYAFEFGRF